MKLTSKQKELLLKKLNKVVPNNKCPSCGTSDLVLGDRIYELREFSGGGLTIGGDSSIIPIIALFCQNCGQTHFFNAITLGIISVKDEADDRE